MDYFQAIVLGIIQGITEWLPISSQAMVFLVGRLFFDIAHTEALKISIWLHSGTLLAVVVYFWKDIVRILGSIFKKNSSEDKKLFSFLVLSTIVTGVIAVPLLFFLFWIEVPEVYEKLFEALFTIIIGLFLIIVAFLQKKTEKLKHSEQTTPLTTKNSVIVGIAQGFAALPGFSRSGLTIATLLAQKYSLKDTFYLSFLMSIPVVFLAQIALPIIGKIIKEDFAITSQLLIGALTAAIVGFISIKVLLQFAQRVNFFKVTLTLGIIIIILGIILLIG